MPIRIAAGREPRRPLPPFHLELRDLLDDLHEHGGMSQSDVARLLRVSLTTLECWLASPSSSWHREPHYLVQVGALTILRNLCDQHHPHRS